MMGITLFDYDLLDTADRIVVEQCTSEIKSLVRRSAEDIIEIGIKLVEVKERLGHGHFSTWLGNEFRWSLQTAERLMSVARKFQNQQIVDFAPSALYLLAAPSTPEEARQEALDRAANGEVISHSTAKKIVDSYKPQSVASNGKATADYAEEEAKRFVSSVEPDEDEQLLDNAAGNETAYEWSTDTPFDTSQSNEAKTIELDEDERRNAYFFAKFQEGERLFNRWWDAETSKNRQQYREQLCNLMIRVDKER